MLFVIKHYVIEHSNCKNEYLVLALGEETAVHAIVGSIVWAFRRFKKPRCREMSARGYALHSVSCPELSVFLPSLISCRLSCFGQFVREFDLVVTSLPCRCGINKSRWWDSLHTSLSPVCRYVSRSNQITSCHTTPITGGHLHVIIDKHCNISWWRSKIRDRKYSIHTIHKPRISRIQVNRQILPELREY